MRNALLSLTSIVLCMGCATTPQSRDEFKTLSKNHPAYYITASHTANRRFESVAATLQKKWKECYNVQVTTSRTTQSGMTTSRYRETFHPRITKVNKSLVEMTLQSTTQGMTMLNKVPEGGEYIVALDVVRLSGNKTRIDWYSPASGWKESWETAQRWSDGKNLPCPKG